MMLDVSFIIPHKGRNELLFETLKSIAQQDYDLSMLETIVVSQNADDYDYPASIIENINLTTLRTEPKNSVAFSRNLGAANAKGKYIAFIDADVYLSADWLKTMLSLIDSKSAILVSAMQKDSPAAPAIEKIRTAMYNSKLDTYVSELGGANLFLLKTSFDRAKGFPEHLTTCEDIFFTQQLSRLGKIYNASNAHYIHLGEDKSFRAMFRKEIWRSESNIASIKGRRIPIRELPSFIVPLAIPSLLILMLTCLLVNQITFAVIAGCLAALPIVVYSLRLKGLVGKDISLWHCLIFYLYYFPARAIGTLAGVFKSIGTASHT